MMWPTGESLPLMLEKMSVEFLSAGSVILMSFIFLIWFFVFVVGVVPSIWRHNLTILFSRQQLFFKKMKIILEARRAA